MATEEDTGAHFEPVMKLDEVEVKTGEEDELVLYKHRSRVYRFDVENNEWKERGTGDVKLLFHPPTRKARVVLREDKTLKLRVNHGVIPGLELKPNLGSDRAWTWACTDYSEAEPQTCTFAIKFRNAEVAEEYKKKYIEAQEIMEGKREPPADAKAEEPAKAEEANPWVKIVGDGKLLKPLSEEQLQEVWNKYDADGNKAIDASELEKLMLDVVRAVIGLEKEPLEDGLVEKLEAQIPEVSAKVLKLLDTDKDGNVSWDEFQKLNDVAIV